MRVRQDTAPHLFAVESETDSEQWYQVFANGRSEEHTSELQSPCNLVCRLILSEEHTSELQSPCNLVCRLLLEKKKRWGLDLKEATPPAEELPPLDSIAASEYIVSPPHVLPDF